MNRSLLGAAMLACVLAVAAIGTTSGAAPSPPDS
jgi:hypothetical protein